MTKREKMILAITAVVALVGVYMLLFSPSGKSTESSTARARLTELRDLATKISEEIKKEDLTATERHILERADSEWVKDPFVGKKLLASAEATRDKENLNIAYTGFVDTGRKRLAVINGLEYEIGETLEVGGYVVRSIDPELVILEDKDKRGKVTIHFTGEDF